MQLGRITIAFYALDCQTPIQAPNGEAARRWVKPSVKAEYQRIAKAEGLSLSRTGAAALEEWLAGRLQVHYAGLLQPIIAQAIAKEMRSLQQPDSHAVSPQHVHQRADQSHYLQHLTQATRHDRR